ncbi:MAG: hypothetical protein OEY27_04220 [Gammaproteobacteria bacterium]|nr:hypothetical protein [Gammaproteobacteria bacterium]
MKSLFCTTGIIASCLLMAPAMAWQPPIGIPQPAFGINEQAPALPDPWNSNISGFYFVQSGGNNSGNGYPGNPRGTIPSTLAAGSVVILSGTYTEKHGNNPINAAGTAAKPVYIRGMSDSQRATITQAWVVNGSYYILEHIKAVWANSSGDGSLEINGNHGTVRHSDMRRHR